MARNPTARPFYEVIYHVEGYTLADAFRPHPGWGTRTFRANVGDLGEHTEADMIAWARQDAPERHRLTSITLYPDGADERVIYSDPPCKFKAPDGVRAIERHGDAAILDRAFTGFTALPPPIVAGMKRPWREVMEFPPLAVVSAEMVTARYRKLAMERHSDRPGGSDAKMAELNAARDEALSEVAP